MSLAGFFTQTSLLNLLLQIIMSIALILYVVTVMPFELKRDNWIEVMNESFILAIFYMTLGVIVNDYGLSPEMKYNLGYAMMGVVLLNIVANFLIFLVSLLFQLYRCLKELFLKLKSHKFFQDAKQKLCLGLTSEAPLNEDQGMFNSIQEGNDCSQLDEPRSPDTPFRDEQINSETFKPHQLKSQNLQVQHHATTLDDYYGEQRLKGSQIPPPPASTNINMIQYSDS